MPCQVTITEPVKIKKTTVAAYLVPGTLFRIGTRTYLRCEEGAIRFSNYGSDTPAVITKMDLYGGIYQAAETLDGNVTINVTIN